MHTITYESLKNIIKTENNIIINILKCGKYKVIYLHYVLCHTKTFDNIIIICNNDDILNIFDLCQNMYIYMVTEIDINKNFLKDLNIKKDFLFQNFKNLNFEKENIYIDLEIENNFENLKLEKTLKFNNYFLNMCSVIQECTEKIGIYLNIDEDTFYINYITKELLKNYNLSFFVFSENIDIIYNLKKIFGDKINFIYFKNYNFYLFANIINLSFFDSIITYKEDEITLFLKNYYNINILFFRDIKNEINKYTNNISIVQGCKNRNANLVNSMLSYINNDKIDEAVIVDFNSVHDVREFIKKNNIISTKIVFIKIINNIPWIASWCNNIGMYFAKNNIILKLDADNIILNNSKITDIDTLNSDNKILHVDWRHANNENERHLNGVFMITKNNLKKYGYHDQKNVFYGWEDEEIKKRIKKYITEEYLKPSYFFHQSQKDYDRLKNQNLLVEFYGFPLCIFNKVDLFIFYNEHISNIYDLEIYESEVENLFDIKKFERNYIEIEIKKEIKKEKCNYNIFSEQEYSCCKIGIFKYLVTKKYRIWWLNKKIVDFYYNMISKYNINDEKELLLLYIILQFEFSDCKINSFTFKITNFKEKNITESLENLYDIFVNMRINIKNIELDTINKEINKETNIVSDLINFIRLK
jgi:hypothetical protein